MLQHGAIAAADLDLFHVTDDADEAVELIRTHRAEGDVA
jgi:predicted Rossmann-fold nucleotide-binding protein